VRVLIVEDERRLAGRTAQGLREEGFAVDVAALRAEAVDRFIENEYDLVILDLGLPDGDGLDLLRDWRAEGAIVPVLVLTAYDRLDDKIAGLDAGADDYLTKPFAFEELLARSRALLRRVPVPQRATLVFEDVELDRTARLARRAGRELSLTTKELALLEFFLLHPEAALSRETIAEHVWDATYEARSNVIDVIVSRLRRKLEAEGGLRLIRAVPGVGWALRAPSRDDA